MSEENEFTAAEWSPATERAFIYCQWSGAKLLHNTVLYVLWVLLRITARFDFLHLHR